MTSKESQYVEQNPPSELRKHTVAQVTNVFLFVELERRNGGSNRGAELDFVDGNVLYAICHMRKPR